MKPIYIIFLIMLSVSLIQADDFRDPTFQTVTAAGVTLNYRVIDNGLNLDCQLIAATTGWVAVGFAPTNQMQNANFIIGYHSSGNTFIRDDYGVASTSHASDTSLGGTNNIITSSSTEVDGVTQLNFKIPLNSGDSFDKVLVIGNTYGIILGRGFNSGDSFTSSHAAVGSAQITVPQSVSLVDDFLTAPSFALSSYPNPFSSSTRIDLELKNDAVLEINVFNLKGQRVRTYPAALYRQGVSQLVWDGRNDRNQALPDGVYFLSAVSGGKAKTHKLVLLR